MYASTNACCGNVMLCIYVQFTCFLLNIIVCISMYVQFVHIPSLLKACKNLNRQAYDRNTCNFRELMCLFLFNVILISTICVRLHKLIVQRTCLRIAINNWTLLSIWRLFYLWAICRHSLIIGTYYEWVIFVYTLNDFFYEWNINEIACCCAWFIHIVKSSMKGSVTYNFFYYRSLYAVACTHYIFFPYDLLLDSIQRILIICQMIGLSVLATKLITSFPVMHVFKLCALLTGSCTKRRK